MNLLYKIFFVLMLFSCTTVFAQLPDNIGFEKGNFDGWECSSGKRKSAFVFDIDAVGPLNGRHTIKGPANKNELDVFGHFPVLCPNGSGYSLKLGNDLLSKNVTRISRTISVPAGVSSYSLIFNYAIVLDANDNHAYNDQPLFKVQVFDVLTGNALSCFSLDFVASSSDLPGFKVSDVESKKTVANLITKPIYRDWSSAMLDLSDFAGKEVRLEFTTIDCNGSAHFAYAYLDIDEKLSLNPITGNVFCINQTVTTLTGPTGFASYTWYNKKDLTKPIVGQSIVVPAVDGEEYELHITPYLNLGCPEILNITLKKLAEPFKLVVQPEINGCPDVGIDLTAANITIGSSATMVFSYYKDQFGLEYLPTPHAIKKSGIYYIRGTNAGGCTDILPIKVILENPTITVTDPFPVRYPNKVNLSLTHNTAAAFTYSYFSDLEGKIEIDKYIGITGTYYVKVTKDNLCSIIAPVKVVVNPPPPYSIEAPNTFTPNSDGVNDLFKIKIDGFVSLTQLTIFNRYGQQVFITRSINDYWTGNKGSSPLPTGTYYWIFDGTDDYYHTKVKMSSSITIIR